MKLNKKKLTCFKNLFKSIPLIISFFTFITLNGNFLNAESLFEELQKDSSTKTEDDSSGIPANPFEIVEMIRRYNSLNDATRPSDALDNALNSFKNLEEN